MSEDDERHDGTPAEVWLRQPAVQAAFTPSEGCCCTAFRARQGDHWLPILAEPPTWSALRARPAFYGSPLLAPYAFNIAGGGFTYRGRQRRLRPGRTGRLAHGLARDYPWLVEDVWEDAGGAHLRASITTAEQTARLDEYPFPFSLHVTVTLSGTSLLTTYEAANVGVEPMPFGLGVHPYFPLPLHPAGDRETCHLWADARHSVVVADHALHLAPPHPALDLRRQPTAGAVLAANPAGEHGRPLLVTYAGEIDRAERAGAGLSFSLTDRAGGLQVRLETSADFQALVLFAPPDGRVISPVLSTNLPDAFELQAHGQPSGLIELAPQERWHGWARLIVLPSS